MSIRSRLVVVLATLIAALPCAAQDEGATLPAAVGDQVPDFELPELVGHDGRTRLSELFGQPVVVAGFRQHLRDGVHAAWVANDLHRKHAADGLVVVALDTVAWKNDMWAVKQSFFLRFFATLPWLGSCPVTAPDLPIVRTNSKHDDFSLILIGIDGTLVCEGTAELASAPAKSTDYRATLEKAVASELKRRATGWGEHAAAQQARAAAFGKGSFAEGMRILARARTADPAGAAEYDVVQQEVERAFGVATRRVQRLLDGGRFREAEQARKQLTRGVKGHAPFEKTLAEFEDGLDGTDWKQGLALDRELAQIVAPLEEMKLNKFEVDHIVRLRRFAQKNSEHSVGKRAQQMDPLLYDILATTKGLTRSALDALIEKASK